MHEQAESAGRAHPSSAGADRLTERVLSARAGLAALLSEADRARRRRAESGWDAKAGGSATAASEPDGGAVCAWNHFENIPTFYNWNNRPR